MLNTFLFAAMVGTLLGFLAGLGIGGGSLLMLWLTLVIQADQAEARCINLLFFLPTALAACFFRWKDGSLNLKKIAPAMLAGCLSAGLFSLLSRNLELTILKKTFGLLLLVTGLRELFYRPRKAR